MMGQQARTDSLFYYFRLEDQIPDDHLLKRLDRFIDLGFVRERLRDTYSAMGRPSIDPEVLLRLLLVGYLYGITSERRFRQASQVPNVTFLIRANAPSIARRRRTSVEAILALIRKRNSRSACISEKHCHTGGMFVRAGIFSQIDMYLSC